MGFRQAIQSRTDPLLLLARGTPDASALLPAFPVLGESWRPDFQIGEA